MDIRADDDKMSDFDSDSSASITFRGVVTRLEQNKEKLERCCRRLMQPGEHYLKAVALAEKRNATASLKLSVCVGQDAGLASSRIRHFVDLCCGNSIEPVCCHSSEEWPPRTSRRNCYHDSACGVN